MNKTIRTLLTFFSLVLCFSGCARENLMPNNLVTVVESLVNSHFLGTPAITKFQGKYYISHDYYGEHPKNISSIYMSENLQHWEKLADINGIYWASLFVYQGKLFLLGTDEEYGNIAIKYSENGKDWQGKTLKQGSFHTSSQPVFIKDNKIYQTYELVTSKNNRHSWGNFVLSVDLTTLKPTLSNVVYHQQKQQWIEENIIQNNQTNAIEVFYRKNCDDNSTGVKMIYKLNENLLGWQEYTPVFGAGSKFFIEKIREGYIMLANPLSDCGGNHHVLTLFYSENTVDWRARKVLLSNADAKHHGYQYPNMIIDGDRLLIVIRVADNQANFHDANRIQLLIQPVKELGLGKK